MGYLMRTAVDGMMVILTCLFAIVLIVSLIVGVEAEWIFAFLTAILSVLGWIYSSAKNSQREIEARLFSQKAALYGKIFDIFPGLLKKAKGMPHSNNSNKSPNDEALPSRLIDIKTGLLIWGSEETIRAWMHLESNAHYDEANLAQQALNFGKLYKSMRFDLGHRDYTIKEHDLIGLYMDAEGKDALRK